MSGKNGDLFIHEDAKALLEVFEGVAEPGAIRSLRHAITIQSKTLDDAMRLMQRLLCVINESGIEVPAAWAGDITHMMLRAHRYDKSMIGAAIECILKYPPTYDLEPDAQLLDDGRFLLETFEEAAGPYVIVSLGHAITLQSQALDSTMRFLDHFLNTIVESKVPTPAPWEDAVRDIDTCIHVYERSMVCNASSRIMKHPLFGRMFYSGRVENAENVEVSRDVTSAYPCEVDFTPPEEEEK